jgi:hypothetical protein
MRYVHVCLKRRVIDLCEHVHVCVHRAIMVLIEKHAHTSYVCSLFSMFSIWISISVLISKAFKRLSIGLLKLNKYTVRYYHIKFVENSSCSFWVDLVLLFILYLGSSEDFLLSHHFHPCSASCTKYTENHQNMMLILSLASKCWSTRYWIVWHLVPRCCELKN